MSIFRRDLLANTLTACWWMASSFVVGYSIGTLFATHLQKDLGLSAGLVALPIMLQNLLFFLSCCCWGWVADRIGRRWAMILPALLAIPVTPLYLLTNDYTMIVVFFALQGCFGAGGIYGQNASYMTERFPTEVRATASGFCYHQGAIFGGLMGPIIAYAATTWQLGFAIPMLIGTWVGLVSFIVALLLQPGDQGETDGGGPDPGVNSEPRHPRRQPEQHAPDRLQICLHVHRDMLPRRMDVAQAPFQPAALEQRRPARRLIHQIHRLDRALRGMARRQPYRRPCAQRDRSARHRILPHRPQLAEQIRPPRTQHRLGARQFRLCQRLVAQDGRRARGLLLRADLDHALRSPPARCPARPSRCN